MKRGCYDFFSPENKSKVAKYAAENGVTASLHHFKQTDKFNYLKESTVHGWVKHVSNYVPDTIQFYRKDICMRFVNVWSYLANK